MSFVGSLRWTFFKKNIFEETLYRKQMAEHLFLAETPQGHSIKVLIEILNSCSAKDICVKICKKGIFLHYIDNKGTILIVVSLDRKDFRNFDYNADVDTNIGVNIQKFLVLLRSIKKKDVLTLYIPKECQTHLRVQIAPVSLGKKSSAKVEDYGLKIHKISGEEVEVPEEEGYHFPKVIPSSEFQKVCKKMNLLGKTTKINMEESSYLKFSSDCTDVMDGGISFGEPLKKGESYEAEFTTFSLNQLVKIPGLSSDAQFFQPKISNYPFKISLSVGGIGKAEFFIKDRQTIEQEEGNSRV
ncbi:proliferating cell nuclear antigen [Marseillevirus marseillevirus]|uniref:Proliferating cell nuclear antigen n=2 Tax=Marseillevirus TaxID=1513458 RepID=D2XAL4_GBMV|nr:proliferating cell nuclear antigen [Marseillevirus marseillevirus]ADB03991.1 proliferating cell nuclear antigen [Marseillevirus marseillevirus]AVR52927.1 proliferating cell nuclear antigen [Marseillevirus Shanghai 1]